MRTPLCASALLLLAACSSPPKQTEAERVRDSLIIQERMKAIDVELAYRKAHPETTLLYFVQQHRAVLSATLDAGTLSVTFLNGASAPRPAYYCKLARANFPGDWVAKVELSDRAGHSLGRCDCE